MVFVYTRAAMRIWNDPNCERTANASEGIDWDLARLDSPGCLQRQPVA